MIMSYNDYHELLGLIAQYPPFHLNSIFHLFLPPFGSQEAQDM